MNYETEKRGDLKLLQEANLKKARRTAIAFGIIFGAFLIALVYGHVQHEIVVKQMKQIDSLKIELKKKTN